MTAIQGAPQGVDRRRDARHPTTVPAQLTLVGFTVEGRLQNVSARGVCFLTASPHLRVAESNFVRVRFTLPPGEGGNASRAEQVVERYVRVTRIEPADVDGAPGRRLGLAWDEPIVLTALA